MSQPGARRPDTLDATSKSPLWKPIAVAAGFAILVASSGAALTTLDAWYFGLKLPSWKPPDIAFGPIWTTIFVLCAIAAVLGWRRLPTAARRRAMVWAFVANGVLNVLWSLLYFKLHRPDWAMIELPFLWLSVLVAMLVLRPVRIASWMLLPYLVWVGVAAALNWETICLNGPFA